MSLSIAFGQQRREQSSSQMRRNERTKLPGSTRHPEVGKSFLTVTGSVAPCPCCHPPITGLSAVASGALLYADLAGRGGCRLCRLADTESANMCISSNARAWQPSRPESAFGTCPGSFTATIPLTSSDDHTPGVGPQSALAYVRQRHLDRRSDQQPHPNRSRRAARRTRRPAPWRCAWWRRLAPRRITGAPG